jgi:hypothetical protein
MSRRRQILMALALGVVGLAGVSLVAMGEGGVTDNARAGYAALMARSDVSKIDDLCRLAKYCLQNNMPEESRSNAVAALQKDPGDLRAKYILYALATAPATTATGTDINIERPIDTISAADVDRIYTEEGNAQMLRFATDVQPLLVARCGAARCHGNARNPKWTLITKETTDRRVIAQNFLAISKFLNRDSVESLAGSRLIQAPLKGPDGGHPAQVFRSVTDPTYLRIQAWAKTLMTDLQIIFARSSSTPAAATPTESAGTPAPVVPPPPVPVPDPAAPPAL